jgi:hypothetical protein
LGAANLDAPEDQAEAFLRELERQGMRTVQ